MPIFDFLKKLFDTSDFPARWHCGNWSDGHGWLHVLSDVCIFAAYMAIPIVLAVFIRRRRDLPFPRVFWLFVAFIAFCGCGHLLEAVIFWKPIYRISGLIKLGTAVASWATVLALVPTVRRALLLRSPEQLEHEVAKRTRELQLEKAKLEAILSALGTGVAVADAAGDLTVFNRAAAAILGRGPEKVPVDRWGDVYGLYRTNGTKYEVVDLPFSRLLQSDVAFDEDVIVRSPFVDGERTLSVSGRRVAAENFDGGVVVFADITDRVREQQELARSNDDLQQFAYAAAHDLREPLRQIASFGGLLSEEAAGKLDAEEQEWLRIMQDGAKRMDALVLGLLAYTSARDQSVASSAIELQPVLDGVLADLTSIITDSKARVKAGDLPRVRAEETPLRQLLQNLVSNAIKFAGEGPPDIRVTAQAELGAPGMIRVSVEDDGLGIAPEHQEHVFRIFKRLHTHEEIEGSGIGLSLCRRITERWGGSIWVESDGGRGTTVHFTVPSDPDPD